MDLGEETKDECHTLYPLFLGFLGRVSRYCGTSKIREWGPPYIPLNIMKPNSFNYYIKTRAQTLKSHSHS